MDQANPATSSMDESTRVSDQKVQVQVGLGSAFDFPFPSAGAKGPEKRWRNRHSSGN